MVFHLFFVSARVQISFFSLYFDVIWAKVAAMEPVSIYSIKKYTKVSIDNSINKYIKVSIDNNPIKQSHHIKYLGVLRDDNLNWKQQIKKQCSKVAKGSWALN